jgi:hypothetical protein
MLDFDQYKIQIVQPSPHFDARQSQRNISDIEVLNAIDKGDMELQKVIRMKKDEDYYVVKFTHSSPSGSRGEYREIVVIGKLQFHTAEWGYRFIAMTTWAIGENSTPKDWKQLFWNNQPFDRP